MKIAIMQPYFLPYIGYWQLISAVDRFVVLDDVNYINRGWINRNRIAVGGKPVWMTLPLVGASQNRLICDINLVPNDGWREKLSALIANAYTESSHFNQILPIFYEILERASGNLSSFLSLVIQRICDLLKIETEIISTSRIFPKGDLKGQNRILDICKNLGADEYWNLPGGKDLYQVEKFEMHGISLRFLESQTPYLGTAFSGTESLSILHLMMNMHMNDLQKMMAPCQ
jgi:WbqC-like protein family